jgi:hypothetical protein
VTAALWGIPTLDPAIAPQSPADLPSSWAKWASYNRSSNTAGRGLHFYTADRKFSSLWRDPSVVARLSPRCVVEPNYSTWAELPRAVALHDVFRKRSIARAWQALGLPVLVDLDVDGAFHDLALLGVPPSYPAYCYRCHRSGGAPAVDAAYEWAVRHRGSDPPVFVVVGGGRAVRDSCRTNRLRHVPEDARSVRGLA